MLHWIGHILGLDDANGTWYLFWSGVCADLGMVAGAWTIVRKHNCDRRNCLRVGRFHSGDRLYCRKHHPHDAPDGPC